MEGRSLFYKAVWKFSRANPLGFKTWEQCSVAWRLCSGPKTPSPESSPFSLKVSICFQLSSFVCFLPVAFGEYSILFFILSCLLPFQFRLVWASQKPSVRLLPILEIPATAPPWSWVLAVVVVGQWGRLRTAVSTGFFPWLPLWSSPIDFPHRGSPHGSVFYKLDGLRISHIIKFWFFLLNSSV